MIEEALIGANFLVPHKQPKKKEGYINRELYCEHLKMGADIGVFNETGQFIKDHALSRKYLKEIPLIADALTRSPRHPSYRDYKLASLHKGCLTLHLEWRFENALDERQLSLQLGRMIRDQAGFTTLLIDMHGPTYEVIAPDTIIPFFENIHIPDLK